MTGEHEDGVPPELARTMRYWLARTCRETREQTKDQPKPKDVAFLANVDVSGISRFENYQSWPRQIDRIVAAYAVLCGIEDGRDLWETALERYRKRGGRPVLGDLSRAQRALLQAAEVAPRRQPYAAESRDKPTSIRRRRANG